MVYVASIEIIRYCATYQTRKYVTNTAYLKPTWGYARAQKDTIELLHNNSVLLGSTSRNYKYVFIRTKTEHLLGPLSQDITWYKRASLTGLMTTYLI